MSDPMELRVLPADLDVQALLIAPLEEDLCLRRLYSSEHINFISDLYTKHRLCVWHFANALRVLSSPETPKFEGKGDA